MLVPFAQDDIDLIFREMRIDKGNRDAMKREVPRRIPGEFPFVRHRHDPFIMKMTPLRVAPQFSFGWGRRLTSIALEPTLNNIMIELFRPQHSGQGLSLD